MDGVISGWASAPPVGKFFSPMSHSQIFANVHKMLARRWSKDDLELAFEYDDDMSWHYATFEVDTVPKHVFFIQHDGQIGVNAFRHITGFDGDKIVVFQANGITNDAKKIVKSKKF